ncbi:MAG: FAD-binding protein [Chlamydiales bacterium]|nr:FAD-binding protein [Chlamydiia bacterium]MCP5508323.1 FAD-binding protein [Chlamydiales bacterium]
MTTSHSSPSATLGKRTNNSIDTAALQRELSRGTSGDVRFDTATRTIYSIDASIYEVEPLGVVIPKNVEDIIATVKIANKYGAPLIPRGAATGITGGCLGTGIIIDTSKFLNRILEINYDEEYALCEPGVIQDQLNAALSSHGYRLGPDTSTGNRATIGGMVGNNAAGSRSLYYGTMADHVIAIDLILANGELITFHAVDNDTCTAKCEQLDAEGRIYREVCRIRGEYREAIIEHFPPMPRRVSGYRLNQLIADEPLNIAKLIVGSEGTLGITAAIKVKISKKPPESGLCLIYYDDIIEAMRHVPDLLRFSPISLEMIDANIINAGRSTPLLRGRTEWLKGTPAALFVLECPITNLESIAGQITCGTQVMPVSDKIKIDSLLTLRKSGLGLLLSKRSYSRAIAFLEDVSIPPQHLASFMQRFIALLDSHGKKAGIYGHVGSGCMHIRPYIDLRDPQELQRMHQLMLETTELLIEEGGALSGEHGDGLIRSWLNRRFFGETIYRAFTQLKAAFDPENCMNPNKIVDGPPLEKNLRMSPSVHQHQVDTFLDFSKEGGFSLSVDLCNGNGNCRKPETLMCPPFQATCDEYHTTRARAQMLRAVVNGKLPLKELTGRDVYDVLDLCIECKGCKSECPSQVDMAKIKAELLYQYQEKHGYSLRSKIFGNIGAINRISAPIAKLANWINRSYPIRQILHWIGITKERPLPQLASQQFSEWIAQQEKKEGSPVVLFNDTFTEFNTPHIGISAYQVLSSLGYQVIVPPWHCCGRPQISKGLLQQAKKQALALLNVLAPYAEQKVPIIGLEPSCILTIKDDYPSFTDTADAVASCCITFDEFLKQENHRFPSDDTILVHTHCHQKALIGTDSIDSLYENAEQIPSGCCGMAGSFGYEKEHYALSMQIGNLHLFPAVREASENTVIIANGTSCRAQILHGTGRRALHLAEYLQQLTLPDSGDQSS